MAGHNTEHTKQNRNQHEKKRVNEDNAAKKNGFYIQLPILSPMAPTQYTCLSMLCCTQQTGSFNNSKTTKTKKKQQQKNEKVWKPGLKKQQKRHRKQQTAISTRDHSRLKYKNGWGPNKKISPYTFPSRTLRTLPIYRVIYCLLQLGVIKRFKPRTHHDPAGPIAAAIRCCAESVEVDTDPTPGARARSRKSYGFHPAKWAERPYRSSWNI